MYPFLSRWALGLLPPLSAVNHTAVDIHMPPSVWVDGLSVRGHLGGDVLGHPAALGFTFGATAGWAQRLPHFLFPRAAYEGPNPSTASPTLINIPGLYDGIRGNFFFNFNFLSFKNVFVPGANLHFNCCFVIFGLS